MDEFRCGGTMQARISEDNKSIEFKCKRRGCGSKPGVVVLHTFDLETRELIGTKRFADPRNTRKDNHAIDRTRTSIRSA